MIIMIVLICLEGIDVILLFFMKQFID